MKLMRIIPQILAEVAMRYTSKAITKIAMVNMIKSKTIPALRWPTL